jgi:2-C-methyl-D-erythritol 4-phosphate cytidylyltransferase
MKNPKFTVVLVSGGLGSRMGGPIPKQYLPVFRKPLALYSLEIFCAMPEAERIVIVCEKSYEELFISAAGEKKELLHFAPPGQRRQDSVFNGISLLQDDELVCIHDAVRPLINRNDIYKVVATADQWNAAVLGVKAKATIKKCDSHQLILETPYRDHLWEIQTPQVIRLNLLKEGFRYAKDNQLTVTDDASLVELIGKPVKVVEGSYTNIKVTTPEDLEIVEKWIGKHAVLQNHTCL